MAKLEVSVMTVEGNLGSKCWSRGAVVKANLRVLKACVAASLNPLNDC